MSFGPTDYFMIIAKKGHGKTTLGCAIDRAYPRIIVIDRMCEKVYTDRARSGDPCIAIAEGLTQLRRGMEWTLGRPRFELIYRFPIGTTKRDAEFTDALWLAYKRGSVSIKIEEVWFCATPHFMPPVLEDIAFTGRHRGCSLITTTQLPAQVNKKLLGMCEHRFYGRISEKNALHYLADDLGDDVDKLRTLEKGSFLWKRDDAPSQIVSNR